jgi:hydrogenase nickel incorporation protein HypA/HybF
VHELSIASNLVDIVSESAGKANARRVVAVHLRLGALAGVAIDSLQFCYDIAASGTPLEGSRLTIEEVPAMIFCRACDRAVELPSTQLFMCPMCGTPSAELRQGKELEIESIEIED